MMARIKKKKYSKQIILLRRYTCPKQSFKKINQIQSISHLPIIIEILYIYLIFIYIYCILFLNSSSILRMISLEIALGICIDLFLN